MTEHTETAQWLLARARDLNNNIAQSAAEMRQAEAYVAPYALANIRAELEKTAELARYLANGAAAIYDLEARLDNALERLSDVIHLETLLAIARRLGVDATTRVEALLVAILKGETQ